MRKLFIALTAITALAVAAPAAAAPAAASGGATMDKDLTVWALLAPYAHSAGGGFGLGARYQLELVPAGVLHLHNGVRDEIGLEFGADWAHYSFDFFGESWTYNEISPTVGVAWNFWLNPQLVLYPKIDLAFRYGTWSGSSIVGHPGGYGGAGLELAAGLGYRFNNQVALRVEAGTYALRLGVAFAL